MLSLATCYSRRNIRSDPHTIYAEPTHVQRLAGMEERGKATGEFVSGKIFCASRVHIARGSFPLDPLHTSTTSTQLYTTKTEIYQKANTTNGVITTFTHIFTEFYKKLSLFGNGSWNPPLVSTRGMDRPSVSPQIRKEDRNGTRCVVRCKIQGNAEMDYPVVEWSEPWCIRATDTNRSTQLAFSRLFTLGD